MSAGPGELSEAPELRGLALSRAEVDRTTARRGDTESLAAAWADPGTRVVVVEDGRALVGTGPGAEELVFVPPRAGAGGREVCWASRPTRPSTSAWPGR